MLEIINDGSFNPGSIYRIALENFVTYKEVELFPGKSLNLIIGPNGTGKSTFVSAIILGLCGKPGAIGQETKISTFIKNGCKTATIEIELYNNKGLRNIIIKRIIDKGDSSKWYINNEKVVEKKVQEKIKSFNIQVDNLCQLLPQHKVQDFSGLKPKELLESTLKAMGKFESLEHWKKLIEMKSEMLNMTKNLKRDEKNLEKLKKDNESLKHIIEENKKRQQIEKEIKICEKKLLWMESQELKVKVAEHVKEKKMAVELVNSHKTQMEPLKNHLECLQKQITQLETQKLSNSKEIQKLKGQLKDCIKSFEIKEREIQNIDIRYQEKLNNHKTKERELMQARMKLDKLHTDRRALEINSQDENRLKLEYEDLARQKQSVNADIETLNKRRTEETSFFDNHIRQYSRHIQNMENVQAKRLETLKRTREDTYKALMWLRENRDKFKQPVYEPMMLEINFTDPKFARYLESTVPNKDLIAFTFVSPEDMNLFNSIMRKDLKLKLFNAICSPGEGFNIQTRDIRHLSYLGFYTYLLDTVTAPDAILRYLCTQCSIHKVPIGNDHTYRNSDKVPEDIRLFFTENHRFSLRVSAYGTKSSTTIEINNPVLLANTVDDQQITLLKTQLQKYQHDKSTMENEITEQLEIIENKLQELNQRGKEIKNLFDKIKTIEMQIRFQKKKVEDFENEPTIEIEQEEARCRENYKECVSKQCKVHSEIFNIMQNIHNKELIKIRICMIKINAKRDEIDNKDSIYRKLKSNLEAATTKLEDIDKKLKISASKAKQKLEEAMQAFDRKLPTDPNFPYAKEFKALPQERELLHEYRTERLTKLNFMENIDSQTLKDYDDRSKEIERLTNLLKTSCKTSTTKKDDMNRLKSKWLPPLESLVHEIGVKFSQMFAKPGCAGEVVLHKGKGQEDNFEDYGINMMVKFRAQEPLSELTRHTQSGGERAFSTAIYLLALQARTVAPFRCVDEINQGLDVKNERRMLELLIEETTKSKSQYFLLSPTLLRDLNFNEKVMVHTVMKGKHIVNYKEWDNNEFLRRARNGCK